MVYETRLCCPGLPNSFPLGVRRRHDSDLIREDVALYVSGVAIVVVGDGILQRLARCSFYKFQGVRLGLAPLGSEPRWAWTRRTLSRPDSSPERLPRKSLQQKDMSLGRAAKHGEAAPA